MTTPTLSPVTCNGRTIYPGVVCKHLNLTNLSLGPIVAQQQQSLADNGVPLCFPIHLENCNLAGAILAQTNLRGSLFLECNLTEANLMGADLSRVYFDHCDLTKANLAATRLHETVFSGCDLTGASLDSAQGDWLTRFGRGTRLTDASLAGATLAGADTMNAIDVHRLPVGDPRGYDALAVKGIEGDWTVYAGCRSFSLDEAIEHWGDEDYSSSRDISSKPWVGDLYVKAVRNFAASVGYTLAED